MAAGWSTFVLGGGSLEERRWLCWWSCDCRRLKEDGEGDDGCVSCGSPEVAEVAAWVVAGSTRRRREHEASYAAGNYFKILGFFLNFRFQSLMFHKQSVNA
jgi:hypothetical protein